MNFLRATKDTTQEQGTKSSNTKSLKLYRRHKFPHFLRATEGAPRDQGTKSLFGKSIYMRSSKISVEVYIMAFDYIGLIIVTVLNFILGVFWYSPALFGKVWKKEAKLKNVSMSWGHFLTVLLVGLIFGIGIVVAIDFFAITSFWWGLLAGCILAIGFSLPVIITQELWENRSIKLVYINAAYWIIYAALAAGLVAVV